MDRYSLFWQSRFVAPGTGFLDVNVRPKSPERLEIMDGERLAVREVRDFSHNLKILCVIVSHFELHFFHGLENVSQSIRQVTENQLSVVLNFLRREWDFVNKSHLLSQIGQFRRGPQLFVE